MSTHPPDPIIQDLFRFLTPLSSVADSNDEVDRLLTAPVSPDRSLANYNADESDLSPLTSSDEETDGFSTNPRLIVSGRMLRPRAPKPSTSTVEHSTSSPGTMHLPSAPSPVDQPSWTPNRKDSLEDKTPSTTRERRPKPGPFVSENWCHQCRNRPRYAFMRCTSNDESGVLCRKLFCVSCVTKRYPGEIDFDPRLKKWKCPFCKDTCNCTKCCSKRNEKYTSTSNVKIDHDALLYYASLMPGNSNSKKPPPPPPESSKSINKNPKLAQRSSPKSMRKSARTKPSAEKVRKTELKLKPPHDLRSATRGLEDTSAMFEKFGCVSGEYWGAVFSNIDGGKIGVAYVGDQPPDIFVFRVEEEEGLLDESSPPPTKCLGASSGDSS